MLRQLVALVLLGLCRSAPSCAVNSEAQDSVEANCLRFNNLGVVLYHLFFLPYFYAESWARRERVRRRMRSMLKVMPAIIKDTDRILGTSVVPVGGDDG